MSTPINHLSEISACSDAVAWVKESKSESLEAGVSVTKDQLDALQALLAASESEVAGLRAALEGLLDEQNGVPLFTREKEYLSAVDAARTALRPAHAQTKST